MMRMDETADERAVWFQVLHGERIDARIARNPMAGDETVSQHPIQALNM
jgi:hypothetical protein